MQSTIWDHISRWAFPAFFFVISLFGSIVTLDSLGVGIPWVIVTILVIIILFLLALVFVFARKKLEDPIDVLLFHFILPTDGIKPFYNLLIDSASKCLERLGDRKWFLVPRIPTNSFDKLDIWQKYDGVAALKRITGGILLLADDPDENFDRIIASVENTEIPVVMVDVYFNPVGYDVRNRAKMPCFVGGNEVQGGQLAAEILLERIKAACAGREQETKIIIIRGGNTAWELQRIESFKKVVSETLGCAYVETDFLFYQRDEAFEAVYRLLSSMNDEELGFCSGIFAANDDMAIGARNAVREVSRTKGIAINSWIVGYDGTPEMKRLIDRNDDYLAGTIDVKIKEQAETAIYVMKQLVEGNPPKDRVRLINPRKYTKL
ncbi:MAG TPA: sugar ABC transporter substrate-binding protein [Rhizomicrobium sp.]|nr:sugar ABC transporter substrate-binding protein [Rhizomicrobium sp.]